MTHHHGALNSKNGIPRCARCGGPVHPLPLGYFQLCTACRQFSAVEAERGSRRDRGLARRRAPVARAYSHSMVAGGLVEMSSATRFTPGISLMIRLEIRSSRS